MIDALPADARLWEEARECGACGSARWDAAGEVCGKRYARCAECRVVRLYDRVAADQLHRLYAGYYPGGDPSPDELRRQLENPTFAHRLRRLEAAGVDALFLPTAAEIRFCASAGSNQERLACPLRVGT